MKKLLAVLIVLLAAATWAQSPASQLPPGPFAVGDGPGTDVDSVAITGSVTPASLRSGLVAYWSFDGGTYSPVSLTSYPTSNYIGYDSIPNTSHLNLFCPSTCTQGPFSQTTGCVIGNCARSWNLTADGGVSNYGYISTTVNQGYNPNLTRLRYASFASGDMSISFWYKLQNNLPAASFNNWALDTAIANYRIGVVAGSQEMRGYAYDSVSGNQYSVGGNASTSWVHYVWVYTASDKKSRFYVDTVVGADSAALTNGLKSNFGSLNIVTYSGANGTFYVDELGVWNRALSADEVSVLYNSGSGRAYPFYAP